MLDITPFKVLIVLVVALVVLGPERLPRMAHQVARAWRDVQRFRDHIGSGVHETLLGEGPTQPTRTTGTDPAGPAQQHEPRPDAIGGSIEEPERPHAGLN